MSRPASVLFVHGAGSGPWVFDAWLASFTDVVVDAVELQAELDIASATMSDYVQRAVVAARRLPPPVALCGWSMGGLIALLAAEQAEACALVLLEPSAPAEVQGFHPSVEQAEGTFDPDEAYGAFPTGMRARPESALARSERKRGISVPAAPCPVLVLFGDDFPDERGRSVAAVYRCAQLHFRGVDHWGLVREPAVRDAVAAFLLGRR